MNLRTNRAALAEAVRTASTATATTGGAHPVLSAARIDVVGASAVVTCSRLDLTISATVEADTDSTDGTVIIPAALLASFLKAADGETATITVGDDEKTAIVEAGDTTIRLATFNASDWPKLAVAKGKAVELSPAHLHDLGRIVGYAAPRDETLKPILAGVHFAGPIAEATDRYRFARLELGVDVGGEVTIRAESLAAILKTAGSRPLTLRVDQHRATFTSGELEWTTSLLEGDYPKLDGLIRASSSHRIEFPTARLLDAVKRVALAFGDDSASGMYLTADGGKTSVRNRATERGEIVDVVPSTGTLPATVCVHGRHLRDMLENVDDDTVALDVETERKAIECRTERLLQLMMPVADKPAGA